MKKIGIILSCLLLLIVLSLFVFYRDSSGDKRVCFGGKCFSVEVAGSQAVREKGLSGRTYHPQNKGMLFVFEVPARYAFWMKDTKIPLDMIWFGEDSKVSYIKENAQPCRSEVCESYLPDKEAKYVLEVNAGKVKEVGIKVGDKAEIK